MEVLKWASITPLTSKSSPLVPAHRSLAPWPKSGAQPLVASAAKLNAQDEDDWSALLPPGEQAQTTPAVAPEWTVLHERAAPGTGQRPAVRPPVPAAQGPQAVQHDFARTSMQSKAPPPIWKTAAGAGGLQASPDTAVAAPTLKEALAPPALPATSSFGGLLGGNVAMPGIGPLDARVEAGTAPAFAAAVTSPQGMGFAMRLQQPAPPFQMQHAWGVPGSWAAAAAQWMCARGRGPPMPQVSSQPPPKPAPPAAQPAPPATPPPAPPATPAPSPPAVSEASTRTPVAEQKELAAQVAAAVAAGAAAAGVKQAARAASSGVQLQRKVPYRKPQAVDETSTVGSDANASGPIRAGHRVQYWSEVHKKWVPARVRSVKSNAAGQIVCYDLDCKPGALPSRVRLPIRTFPRRSQAVKVEAEGEANAQGKASGFQPGERVRYWSDSNRRWVKATVKHVNKGKDGETTSYDLDAKPQAEACKVKPLSTPANAPPPPPTNEEAKNAKHSPDVSGQGKAGGSGADAGEAEAEVWAALEEAQAKAHPEETKSEGDDRKEGERIVHGVGDRVQYWSEVHKKWLRATVKVVHLGNDGKVASYDLNCKPAAVPSRVRRWQAPKRKALRAPKAAAIGEAFFSPAAEPVEKVSPARASPAPVAVRASATSSKKTLRLSLGPEQAFNVGERVRYWSASVSQWVKARVKVVNKDAGGAVISYDLDAKAQAEVAKVRPFSTSKTAPPPGDDAGDEAGAEFPRVVRSSEAASATGVSSKEQDSASSIIREPLAKRAKVSNEESTI